MAVLEKVITMKAIRMHDYGGPELLIEEDAPRPKPAADEALIRIYAAGVNPVDWKIRKGYSRRYVSHTLPLILGFEAAGIIEEIGSSAVNFNVGDAVFAMVDLARGGAFAEYVAVPARNLARKPVSLDFVHAAGVPLAATTAWQLLFEVAGLTTGQTVLVHGGAGGVGHFAVQFARWKGARVIATTSTPNIEFVRGLGASQVIDYRSTRFEDVVKDVDVVFDLIGGEIQERSLKVLKKGGILVSAVGLNIGNKADALGVRAREFFVRPDGEQLKSIAELIDGGHVKPYIEKIFALSHVVDAEKISEEGHVRGKMVIRVRD